MKRLFLLFAFLLALSCGAQDSPWELAARFDFNAARQALRQAAGTGVESADAAETRELLQAAVLLGVQPRTEDNVRQALAGVRALSARPGISEDTFVAARYLEARILGLHLEPRDGAGARTIHADLLEHHRAHPLAQQGAATLALGLLYDNAQAERPERLAAAEALLARVTSPEAERDLRYVIGHARLRWGLGIGEASAHLEQAAQIGFHQQQRQASLYVTLGQLAEERGDLALARESYRKFLQLARRDTRVHAIGERLAALEGKPGGEADGDSSGVSTPVGPLAGGKEAHR
ncbi:hypothetical protein OPIT5_20725 [Opitutaceae bacterium TAV5]|nr:hypothetical protein OPIT5_20725 [Opitutaceae bacterium TAV5]